jgi:hypothetical protein
MRMFLHRLGICFWRYYESSDGYSIFDGRCCRICFRTQTLITVGAVGTGIKKGWVNE